MIIRMASTADAVGIARVHVDTWRTTYRGLVPDAFLDGLSYETGRERWAKRLAEATSGQFVLVAEDDSGAVVGFAAAGPNRSPGQPDPKPQPPPKELPPKELPPAEPPAEEPPPAEPPPDEPPYEAEIYALYILEAHQRRGIGRRLVQAAAREFGRRGLGSMVVWVLAANPARRFYEALGGRLAGSQPIVIGGATLEEVAYGWADVGTLLPPSAEPAV